VEVIGKTPKGVVYKAYDPELDRLVALKLQKIHPRKKEHLSKTKIRLLREAQLLAKLSHPNVVATHDVGTFGNDLYLAMELVEGRALTQWIQEECPPREQIVQVMAQAGKGLSAAHKIGLVHREFSPDRVLIGGDTSVRILDFAMGHPGIVPSAEGAGAEEFLSQSGLKDQNLISSEQVSVGDITLPSGNPGAGSRPPALGGLPAPSGFYRAPEQHIGAEVEQRTDQYSFCVVLYQALFGRRPFEKDGQDDVLSLLQGRVIIPEGSQVPRRVQKVLRRGLETEVEKRYPSMDHLLAELAPEVRALPSLSPSAGRLGRWLLVAGLVVVAAAAIAALVQGTRSRLSCPSGKELLATVWNEGLRAEARQAFLATGVKSAEAIWILAAGRMDEHGQRWIAAYEPICGPGGRGGESAGARPMAVQSCALDRLEQLRWMGQILAKADREVVEQAPRALGEWSPTTGCAGARASRAEQGQGDRDREQARLELLRAGVLVLFGKSSEARVILLETRKVVEEWKSPLWEAQSAYLAGVIEEESNALEKACESYTRGYFRALSAGDDETAVRAAMRLMFVYGYPLGQRDLAALYGRHIESLLERMDADWEHWGQYHELQSVIDEAQGNLDHALTEALDSLAARQQIAGVAGPKLIASYLRLGEVYALQGAPGKAVEFCQKAVDAARKAFGDFHPIVARSLARLGLALLDNGDPVQGKAQLGSAIENFQQSLGPLPWSSAEDLLWFGLALWKAGDPGMAMGALEQTLELCQARARGCLPESLFAATLGLSRLLWQQNVDRSRAIKLAIQAGAGIGPWKPMPSVRLAIESWRKTMGPG